MTLRGGELVVPAGPGLHERPARRRDQPHAAEDAGRAARGDAGAAGHGRGRAAAAARIRSSCSRRRTRSSTRAPTRCPRRSSTASCSRSRSATRTRTRSGRCSTCRSHGVAPATLADVQPVVGARRARARRSATSTRRRVSDEVVDYVVGDRPRDAASCRASSSARARARSCTCSRPRRRGRWLAERDFVTPDDVAAIAPAGVAAPARAAARGRARALHAPTTPSRPCCRPSPSRR